MQTDANGSAGDPKLTRVLLGCGMAAGPLYLIVGLVQVAIREGFDVQRHALSLLSLGDWGWIQITNFILSGILVIAGAMGTRRLLHPGRGGTWGPILLAFYGIGLIGAGLFVPDPALGFPPGTPMDTMELTSDGMMHFMFGGIGFYALIAACLIFARRFAGLGRPGWAWYSAFTGIAFFVVFAAIVSGSTSATTMLSFYAVVALAWIWHSGLSATLLGQTRVPT